MRTWRQPGCDGATALHAPTPWHAGARCCCRRSRVHSGSRHGLEGHTPRGKHPMQHSKACGSSPAIRQLPTRTQYALDAGPQRLWPLRAGLDPGPVLTGAQPDAAPLPAIQEQQHPQHKPCTSRNRPSSWLDALELEQVGYLSPLELRGSEMLMQEAGGCLVKARTILTRRIRAADDFKIIQMLFKQYRPLMSAVHVCAVLTRLKALFPPVPKSHTSSGSSSRTRGRPATAGQAAAHRPALELVQLSQWVVDFLTATQHLLPSFTMLEVSGCLHALARLRLRSPTLWQQHLITHSAHILTTATFGQLANCVWAFANLGLDPGPDWLDEACACSVHLLNTSRDATPGTSSSSSGQATARQFNSGSWDRATPVQGTTLMPPPQRQPSLQDDSSCGCATSHLVSMCWGLAKLKHNVSPAWSEAVCTEVAARWGRLDSFTLANTAWALATLAVQPDKGWLLGFYEAARGVMPAATSFELSMMLWALVTWQCKPAQQWLESYVSASSNALPLATPEHIARTLWCMARLGWRPPAWWLRRVFQQTMVQAFEFDAQAYSLTFWSVAKLKAMPPSDWIDTMLVAIYEQGMEHWEPQELSNIMWALGIWGHTPDPDWSELFWTVTYHLLPMFIPKQQVSVLWGGIRTGQAPPPHCLRRITKLSYQSRGQYTLGNWATLISCYAALEVTPGHTWCQAFFTTTTPLLLRLAQGTTRGTDNTDSTQLDGGAAGSSSTSSGGVIAAGVGSVAAHMSEADVAAGSGQLHVSTAAGEACEKLVRSLAGLHMTPPPDWGQAFLSASLVHLPGMRLSSVASVTYDVVRLKLQPSHAWVTPFMAAADAKLQLSPQLDRVSLGKLLYAARHLPGAQHAFESWRNADWIGAALEIYD